MYVYEYYHSFRRECNLSLKVNVPQDVFPLVFILMYVYTIMFKLAQYLMHYNIINIKNEFLTINQ